MDSHFVSSLLIRKFQAYWYFLESSRYRLFHSDYKRVNVLFVTTGHQRLANMMATLRQMRKPNRADHGGKGIFWFAVDETFLLEEPLSILRPSWRTATDSRRQLVQQN